MNLPEIPSMSWVQVVGFAVVFVIGPLIAWWLSRKKAKELADAEAKARQAAEEAAARAKDVTTAEETRTINQSIDAQRDAREKFKESLTQEPATPPGATVAAAKPKRTRKRKSTEIV